MGKIKVLLIEDEITLAKIIKDTLESVGFDVCLAYDGEEGLKLFFESKDWMWYREYEKQTRLHP